MDKTDAYNVVDREIYALFEKPLSAQSVDLLFKLTNIRKNIVNVPYKAQNEPQTHSNTRKYDRNINELLDTFILARKSKDSDQYTVALDNLCNEISDLLIEIYDSAYCEEERACIKRSITKIMRNWG